MPVSAETYQRIALEDPDGQWELHRGRLREKPPMTVAHNRLAMKLTDRLLRQLDPRVFEVRTNLGRVRRADETYYIPDVSVIPVALIEDLGANTNVLEVYGDPLPLVVEVWSPSTGGYDIDGKLPEYQRRGDLEIWRLHPIELALTAWRRRPDGGFDEVVLREGIVEPIALPDVRIDLGELFGR